MTAIISLSKLYISHWQCNLYSLYSTVQSIYQFVYTRPSATHISGTSALFTNFQINCIFNTVVKSGAHCIFIILLKLQSWYFLAIFCSIGTWIAFLEDLYAIWKKIIFNLLQGANNLEEKLNKNALELKLFRTILI